MKKITVSDEGKRGLKGQRIPAQKNKLIQQIKEEAVKLYEAKEAEFPEAEMIRETEGKDWVVNQVIKETKKPATKPANKDTEE